MDRIFTVSNRYQLYYKLWDQGQRYYYAICHLIPFDPDNDPLRNYIEDRFPNAVDACEVNDLFAYYTDEVLNYFSISEDEFVNAVNAIKD